MKHIYRRRSRLERRLQHLFYLLHDKLNSLSDGELAYLLVTGGALMVAWTAKFWEMAR